MCIHGSLVGEGFFEVGEGLGVRANPLLLSGFDMRDRLELIGSIKLMPGE
jgi:hypothetical protein